MSDGREILSIVIVRGAIMFLLICLLVLLNQIALGWTPVVLDKFDLRVQKFEHNRDPMTPFTEPEAYDQRAATDFSLTAFRVITMENDIHMETVNEVVKTVGWHWFLGLNVTPWLDLIHEHHSRHVLDDHQNTRRGYPVEDSYGIRLKIYENPTKPRSIFK